MAVLSIDEVVLRYESRTYALDVYDGDFNKYPEGKERRN